MVSAHNKIRGWRAVSLLDQLVSGVMLGGLATVAVLTVLTVMQAIALMADGYSADRAFPRAAGRTWALVGASIGFLAVVITQGAASVDVLTNAVASSPLAATNLVGLVLGLLGIQGHLSEVTFAVAMVSFGAFIVIIREVRG